VTVNGVAYTPYFYVGQKNAPNSAVNFFQSTTNPIQPTFKGDEFVLSNAPQVQAKSASQELKDQLKETKGKQGIIGKVWDGFKNLTGIGAGSNKAQKAIEKFEKGEITQEEAQKAVQKYQRGQEQAVDFVADVATGIISVAAVAAAGVTGGASLLLATGVGAVVKPAIKGIDAISGGREYSAKDFVKDVGTGAINGVLGIATAGIGKFAASGAKSVIMNATKGRVLSAGQNLAIKIGTKALGGSTSGGIFGGITSGIDYVKNGGKFGDKGFFEAVRNGFKAGAILGGITGGAMEGIDAIKTNIPINKVPDSLMESFIEMQAKKMLGLDTSKEEAKLAAKVALAGVSENK